MLKLNLAARLGHRRGVTLFDTPINQKHMAVWLYENLWAYYRDLRWIVELGTGYGALALYWAACAAVRDVPFASFDNRLLPTPQVAGAVCGLGGQLIEADLFTPSGTEQVKAVVSSRQPGLLFCDNGDKQREIETFAPMTAVGTIVLAHDFPREWNNLAYPGLEVLEPWHTESQRHCLRVAVFRRI